MHVHAAVPREMEQAVRQHLAVAHHCDGVRTGSGNEADGLVRPDARGLPDIQAELLRRLLDRRSRQPTAPPGGAVGLRQDMDHIMPRRYGG